jgi:hypothetical protein
MEDLIIDNFEEYKKKGKPFIYYKDYKAINLNQIEAISVEDNEFVGTNNFRRLIGYQIKFEMNSKIEYCWKFDIEEKEECDKVYQKLLNEIGREI